ncbi:alpha/beta hydrolase [Silvibacterium sp.]|uniref:alpha/beta hydrolase n=1 Tax=Silvibacterium sp. TaxID=1964179 RepID=UPI0039E449AF
MKSSNILRQVAVASTLPLAGTVAIAQQPNSTPFLEPKTQAFIDGLAAQGGKPIYTLPYADARKILEDAQSGTVAKRPASVEDREIAAGPTGKISVRVYRPEGVTDKLPVVIYFHGGGWVLGSSNTHDRLLRDLVHETQKAGTATGFIFVNYTPSPEAQYPVPIEQAYAVTKYVAEHAGEFNVDPNRLAVAGDSVGGNMTAAVTLLAKERKGPAIRYQVLFYPVTDASMDTGSYQQFASGPWLTKPAMEWFWDAYAPKAEDREKITVSPLRATSAELKDLPAALVITDENDVLRDEGEAYGRKLSAAGVDTTTVRFLATTHDFVMLNALSETPAARAAIELASDKLAAALAK